MIYGFGPFSMDLERFEVRRGPEKIELSPKVFEVLRALVESAGRTLTREQLLDRVWPDVAVTEAVLSQAVYTLRRALDDEAELVQTVRGRGYRLGLPVTVQTGADEPAPRTRGPEAPRLAPPGWRGRTLALGGLFLGLLAAALYALGRAPDLDLAPVGPIVPAEGSPRSIAVLPFVNLGRDDTQEHLADGITEEIIHALATLPDVRVVARTSVFAFKDSREDVRTIASQLGIENVLEGSVRLANGRARITAQLIDARSGLHRWSNVYERELEDVFAVQEEIAAAIRDALQVELVTSAPARPKPKSLEAYRLYRRGRAAYFLRTRVGFAQALELFEKSVAIDPGYARAWAGISDVHRSIYAIWPREPRDGPTLARAEDAARKAMALAPGSAQSLTALANIHNVRYRDWAEAEAGYLRAIRASPGWPDVHVFYASLLMKRARLREASRHLDRALELDPLSGYAHRQRGRVAYYSGSVDEAIRYLRRGIELNPRDPDAPRLLWAAYLAKGLEVHANEAYLRVLPVWQKPPVRIARRLFGPRWVIARYVSHARAVQARAGPLANGREPSSWERSGDWGLALALAYLRDEARMYEHLERAADHGLGYIAVEPVFDRYRNDPRFIDLVTRAGYGL